MARADAVLLGKVCPHEHLQTSARAPRRQLVILDDLQNPGHWKLFWQLVWRRGNFEIHLGRHQATAIFPVYPVKWLKLAQSIAALIGLTLGWTGVSQALKNRAAGQQLCKSPLGDETTLIENKNAVAGLHRGQAMGDE